MENRPYIGLFIKGVVSALGLTLGTGFAARFTGDATREDVTKIRTYCYGERRC